ncbi:hypothetical protein FOCC_FOCC006474 [Frankliniella occidentalis]|nr:hypothetical protein FOCC_FOCC006474 [Frankliniella occidentalis]
MRMEGKHRPIVKIPANSQPNRVNPPLTIAMRDFLDILSDGNADGMSVESVNICGTSYDKGIALAFSYQHDLPVFGKIEQFVKPLWEDKCFLL